MNPLGVAIPNACVAWSTSPQTQPPATRTVRAFGSTRIPFSIDRSITRPSSQTPSPAPLWPPPRNSSQDVAPATVIDSRDHIGDVRAPSNYGGMFVDHGVVHRSHSVIRCIARVDDLSSESRAQLLPRRGRKRIRHRVLPGHRPLGGVIHFVSGSRSIRRSPRNVATIWLSASSRISWNRIRTDSVESAPRAQSIRQAGYSSSPRLPDIGGRDDS
jgi:hypothetical protein